MYSVIFRHDANETFVVLRTGLSTLTEARDARVCSGDIVVFSDSNVPVSSTEWFWGWELEKDDSYPHRILAQIRNDTYIVGKQL